MTPTVTPPDDRWRLDTITRSATPPLQQTTVCTLSYDADGNLLGYSDGDTSATYSFDAMGRKLRETVNYGTFSKSFSYTYYGNGLKQTFTAPDNTMYTYNYGLNNELQSMQIPGVGNIEIPAYTWNRPATVNYPGGTQRSMTYDALMRLETLVATAPDSTPIMNYGYPEYDEVGNIVTKTTEHGNYAYDYDTSSRLITADNPVLDDENYTYDDVGNRETAAGIAGTWNYNLNNELLGYADVAYGYDDNGNLTEIRIAGSPVWTYTYDAANRLIHAEDGTGTISADYYYDPFGRRLWKEVNGTRTYFLYSEEGLIAEYDASGTEIRSYGYKPDSTWTTDPLWLKQGGTYYWYQNDHLGTPQKLTTQDGTVVWSAQYMAFGEAVVDVETVENNLRFPGQFYDAETGLHYNFQRYYDPKIGRYIQADPIGLGGGMNLFTYAFNTPGNEIDPLGLWVHPHQIVLPQRAVNVVRDASGELDTLYTRLVKDYEGGWLRKRSNQLLVSVFGGAKGEIYFQLYREYEALIGPFLQHPDTKNGLILHYLAEKNWPGGREELTSHNRFVFTCKYGWIDMGHFFLTAKYAYWSRVFGSGDVFDEMIAIGGEHAQEFFRLFTSALGITHPHGESAFTAEDWLSNRLGTEFGAEVFNEGPQTDIAEKWKTFLVESGAVVYDEWVRKEILEKDVLAWWDHYTIPDKENQEDTSCRYTGPREHWNLVKCGATGKSKQFPKAYRVLCCCDTRDCPGSCQDTPVDFERYGYTP